MWSERSKSVVEGDEIVKHAKKEWLKINGKMIDVLGRSMTASGEEFESLMERWKELNQQRWEIYAAMVAEEKRENGGGK